MFQFYAVTSGYEIRYLNISRDIQEELTRKFRQDAEQFLEGREAVDFDPGYTPSSDAIFRIEEFEFQEPLKRCVRNPLNCERIRQQDIAAGNVKALVGASARDDGEVDTAIHRGQGGGPRGVRAAGGGAQGGRIRGRSRHNLHGPACLVLCHRGGPPAT